MNEIFFICCTFWLLIPIINIINWHWPEDEGDDV